MSEQEEDEKSVGLPIPRHHAVLDYPAQMKRRFWWRLTGLIVAVFCLELYSKAKFQTYITPGGPNYSTDYPAAAFGGTIAIIFMSGILPLLWFAIFRKFEYRHYAGPLSVWYVLAAILWGMNYYTDSFHLCLETSSMEECLER